MREGKKRIRQGNYEKPMTLEMLDEMSYLQAVVKESLRVKSSLLMVCPMLDQFVSSNLITLSRFPTSPPNLPIL
jgi:hypothetical protein